MKAVLIYSSYKYNLIQEVACVINTLKSYVYFSCVLNENIVDMVNLNSEVLAQCTAFIKQYNIKRNNCSSGNLIPTALALVPLNSSKDVINNIIYNTTLMDKATVADIKTLERFIHKHS